MEEKLCPECERPIYGRSDKKFCSDACRNAYNNKVYAGDRELIRKINLQLQKNRRILNELIEQPNSKAHRDDMLRSGFDFNYFTHLKIIEHIGEVKYCYDFGYFPDINGFFKIKADQ
jgi:hypothetical protein